MASLLPLPSAKALKKFYENFHRNLKEQENTSRENNRLNAIEKHQPDGKLLDIGAGRGFFVNAASKRNHWEARGLELSKKACEYAKKHYNITLINQNLSTAKLADSSLDVITLFSSLEHMRHPQKILKLVHDKLKPSGLIVFNVPNLRSFEYYLAKALSMNYSGFIFEHLHYFTPKGIEHLLKNSGFKLKDMSSFHFNPVEKLRLHPYWFMVYLIKRLLEKTKVGGNLQLGNVLYVYATKLKKKSQ